MMTNRLGRSTVEVTELGFGGGPLGGLFASLDDDTAAAALAAAWDGGIRYFGTSPHYGIGHSERRTGDLLRGKPRGAYTLSTKVGRLLVPQDPAGRTDESFEVPATHRRVWDFSRDGVPAAPPGGGRHRGRHALGGGGAAQRRVVRAGVPAQVWAGLRGEGLLDERAPVSS